LAFLKVSRALILAPDRRRRLNSASAKAAAIRRRPRFSTRIFSPRARKRNFRRCDRKLSAGIPHADRGVALEKGFEEQAKADWRGRF
jgi:hypothetical protein